MENFLEPQHDQCNQYYNQVCYKRTVIGKAHEIFVLITYA